MRHRLILPFALATFALTGCSSAIQKDGVYDDAVQLREAFIEAGGTCPGETQEENGGKGSILCEKRTRLEVFESDGTMTAMAKVMAGMNGEPILVGENWTIRSNDTDMLGEVKQKLGGELTVN